LHDDVVKLRMFSDVLQEEPVHETHARTELAR
jgi:hypothetical protein